MAELADAQDLKSCGANPPYRFDPGRRHYQKKDTIDWCLFSYAQNPERQYIALREYNIPETNIFLDKLSGKDFRRPEELTGVFVADLVLQILAYVAETERSFIHQRQAEVKVPKEFPKYYMLWKEGKLSSRQAAKALQLSHSTFYRRCLEWERETGNPVSYPLTR